jgi:predicted lipoprotein with Yx(FWY)xxD motif
MRNTIFTVCLITLFCFFTAITLVDGQNPAKAAENVGVKIMEKEAVGRYLADGQGITLYSYAKDEKNVSHCLEGCAVNWPPFHADPAAETVGCNPSDFSTIIRSDGREQTTYKGTPLYYFKNDQYPGDTFGQGLGDVWFLVNP